LPKIPSLTKDRWPEPGKDRAESDEKSNPGCSGAKGCVQSYSDKCSFLNTEKPRRAEYWPFFGFCRERTEFAGADENIPVRTSSVLLVVLLIITFPIWIGIAGGLIGLVFGLVGGAIGIVAGVFGAVVGAIGAVFGAFFGVLFGEWGPFHFSPFWIAVVIVVIVLMTRSRRQAR